MRAHASSRYVRYLDRWHSTVWANTKKYHAPSKDRTSLHAIHKSHPRLRKRECANPASSHLGAWRNSPPPLSSIQRPSAWHGGDLAAAQRWSWPEQIRGLAIAPSGVARRSKAHLRTNRQNGCAAKAQRPRASMGPHTGHGKRNPAVADGECSEPGCWSRVLTEPLESELGVNFGGDPLENVAMALRPLTRPLFRRLVTQES